MIALVCLTLLGGAVWQRAWAQTQTTPATAAATTAASSGSGRTAGATLPDNGATSGGSSGSSGDAAVSFAPPVRTAAAVELQPSALGAPADWAYDAEHGAQAPDLARNWRNTLLVFLPDFDGAPRD